jgi:hypothetical protein
MNGFSRCGRIWSTQSYVAGNAVSFNLADDRMRLRQSSISFRPDFPPHSLSLLLRLPSSLRLGRSDWRQAFRWIKPSPVHLDEQRLVHHPSGVARVRFDRCSTRGRVFRRLERQTGKKTRPVSVCLSSLRKTRPLVEQRSKRTLATPLG